MGILAECGGDTQAKSAGSMAVRNMPKLPAMAIPETRLRGGKSSGKKLG
jgi:hypothetical protein